MANCVNINSSEFKDLKRQTNLSEKVLQAKVGVWQEKNGEENFPSKENIYSNMSVPNRVGLFKKEISGLEKSLIAERISTYNKMNTPIKIYFTQLGQADLYTWKDDERNIFLQKEGTENSSASPETIVALKDMLTRMGVDIHSVKDIVVDGIKQNANAVALLMQKVIQVVEGKETQSLPEEAMHFVTAIIKQTNPELYNQLLKEVNGYVITQQVFNDYGQDPNYQGKDGKPDIIKLKEEAIGKILAEYVINRTDGTNEKPELIAKVENWWSKIVDYLKSLFIKSGFDRASMDVVSGKDIGTANDISEDNNFLQKKAEEHTADQIYTEQDRIKNALLEGASKITPTPDGYTINGKKIANRVSDSVKAWYKARFLEGSLINDEFTASVNNLKAEKGTAGHADLEHALGILTDENHKLRENKLNDDDYVSQLNPNDKSMYVLLRDNLEERLKSFGDDAVFLSEIPLYDPKTDTAGTIDFVAITKEGKVSILDWKFMDLDTNKHDDIPWYKRRAWNLQMDMYKHMINSIYGVKNTDFEQTRMIPIKVIYSEGNNKENILPRLLRVKIGDVNIKNIDEDYLIPVGLANETTGNDRLDKLLSNLNGVYEKLSRETVTSANKNAKVEQLNTLFHAIRQLQMKGNVLPLLHQEKILSKKVKATIEEYNSTFKGKTKEEFPINSIVSAFTAKLETMQAALEPYLTLNTDLSFLFEGELSPEDKELKNAIRDTVDDVLANKEQLKIIDNEYTVKIIGGSDTAEKVVRGLSRLFGTTATIQIKALDVLFKKANAAFHFAGMDIGGELKKLNEHKNNYQTWAKSKGLNLRNQFDIIKKKDSNELIDKYDSKFSIELKKNITDKDIPWIKDNIDVNAYKDYLEKKREEEYQRIEEKTPYRVGTEEQIASEIAREKSKISDIYNILSDKSPGWRLYNEIVQFPRDDKWISKEWIELNKPENTPAKAFYDYIRERNNYYSSIGYIREKAAENFLPWVRKSLSEKLIFGGDITLGEQFLRNISTDENEIGYGAIDPITKKPIDTVPKYLTGKLKGEVSTDLFKTMAMYNEFAIKFKYLTDIEAQARALIRLENNKNCLATSYFGRTERLESGALKENSDNTENTKIVTAMVKAVVYQQRYIQSEAFDISLGKLGTFGKTLNDKLGYKIFPEDLSERQISLNKTITSFNNSFQIMTLGLNPLSSLSNYFGGSTQSFINAGKYFTKTDFAKTEGWLLMNKMGGEDKRKCLAALEYFLPFTEDYNKHAINKLSLEKVNDEAVQSWLMHMMRSSEEAVQRVNFFTYLRNSIIQDGKIVNTREYLRQTEEYRDFYKGTQEERNARTNKFENDVKLLNDEKGVYKLATVNNKGEFNIPEIERKSDSVTELRRKVQQFTSDALGNMTEENKRMIALSVYGKSFMVFKNWIPRLIDVRMGNMKYNSASDAYEWGRTRMIGTMLHQDFSKSIGNLIGTLQGNQRGIDFMRQLYEEKKTSYEQDTNKTLDMTESQFMDLVRQNTKNQMVDLLFYACLMSLYLGLKAIHRDPDEDPAVKARWKFMLKATDKLKDEVTYFYDPTSLIGLVKSGVFPSVQLLQNYQKVLTNFMTEMFAISTGNKELEKKTFTLKYLMKSFKISNQVQGLLPIFYPDMAKDLGIKMQSQAGVR